MYTILYYISNKAFIAKTFCAKRHQMQFQHGEVGATGLQFSICLRYPIQNNSSKTVCTTI